MTYEDGDVGPFADGRTRRADMQALATADDPAHAAHRKLLVPQLAARRINALEHFVAETADRLWDESVNDGVHRVDVGDGQSAADDDRRAA